MAVLATFGSGLGAAHGAEATRAFTYDDWSRIVREKGLDPSVVIYPFSASPAMIEWAERAIDGGGGYSDLQRLIRIQDAMFEDESFDFTYDGMQTLTARQAFEARQGNAARAGTLPGEWAVYVLDARKGPTDQACEDVNGKWATPEWLRRHPVEHPNCTRLGRPRRLPQGAAVTLLA